MATVLLIIHGLVAVALLGATTHQTLATWRQTRVRPGSFFGRFRTVPSSSFANAIVLLHGGTLSLHDRQPHGLVVRMQLPVRQESLAA